MKQAIVAAALLALTAGSAFADNEGGLYAGGGIGQFNLEIDGVDGLDEAIDSTLDSDDTAWKAFVGWRFNPYFALEAAYIDFGAPEDDISISGSSGDYRAELSGFAPYIIGTLPIGPVELFGKVGYYIYDLEVTADLDDLGGDVFSSDDSGEDLMYGGGVGITLFEHLHARLEYEKVDLEDVDDANAFWLSGAWRF